MPHVVDAKNCVYYMSDDTQLIDTISGVYNVSWGHGHQFVVDSLKKRAGEVLVCYKLDHSARRRLTNLLNRLVPYMSKWNFYTTGSEAVEKAIMSAIEWKAKKGEARVTRRVLTISGGFHGKTFGTASFHYPQELFRRPYDITLISEKDLFLERGLPDELDAVLIEPVRGWDGYAYSPRTLAKLRSVAHEREGLFISDETLTGFGRAGVRGFICGSEEGIPIEWDDKGESVTRWEQVKADIIVGAKGMGQGAAKIVAVGYSDAEFPPDFEIEVGKWTTNASNPFDVAVAADITSYHINENMTALSHSLGGRFIESFSSAAMIKGWAPRVTGSLVYLTTGNHTSTFVKELLSRGILATDSTPQLRMAPAFTMEEETTDHVISAIKEIGRQLNFPTE